MSIVRPLAQKLLDGPDGLIAIVGFHEEPRAFDEISRSRSYPTGHYNDCTPRADVSDRASQRQAIGFARHLHVGEHGVDPWMIL